MKVLVVVDMQNDFITGSLGTKEAEAIVGKVADRIRNFNGQVWFTKDTHGEDYMSTQEGGKLPVMHCIKGTDGWELAPELEELIAGGGAVPDDTPARVIEKPTFGSVALAEALKAEQEKEPIESILLVGLCTDICVISNAILLKAYMPEVPVQVDASCCAGVTPESHERALSAMESCQIEILR